MQIKEHVAGLSTCLSSLAMAEGGRGREDRGFSYLIFLGGRGSRIELYRDDGDQSQSSFGTLRDVVRLYSSSHRETRVNHDMANG